MSIPPTPRSVAAPPAELRVIEVDVPLVPGQPPVTIAVPANSPEEAFYLLYHIGNGTTGALAHSTVLQVLRNQYKIKLTKVEAQILQRRVALGMKATEYELRGLAQWGARQRANTARLFRLPTPAVGVGLEVRDWRTYGVGGRTWENLLKRQAARGNTGSSAYEALIGSATRSNVGVNESIARGAKLLKGGGGVLAVAGLGLTAYDIYKAPQEQRGAVATRHAIGFAGGLVASEIGVGLLTIGAGLLLATPPGWVVLAVGLVAGAVGGYIADRIFYPDDYRPAADRLGAGIAIDPRRPGAGLAPGYGRQASTVLPVIDRVDIVVAANDTQATLSNRAYRLAAASAGLPADIQAQFARRYASATGLRWVAGDPSPRTGPGITQGDLALTAGRHIVCELNAAQRAELAGLAARQ